MNNLKERGSKGLHLGLGIKNDPAYTFYIKYGMIELKRNSENTIIVLFVKTNNMKEIINKISEIRTIQQKDDNIWVISEHPIDITQRSYLTNKTSFAKFLKDTQEFIQAKNMNKLNIFKTKV